MALVLNLAVYLGLAAALPRPAREQARLDALFLSTEAPTVAAPLAPRPA